MAAFATTAAALISLGSFRGAAEAQTPPFRGNVPSMGGPALLITSTDVVPADLAGALGAAGCHTRLIAVTQNGQWLLYIPGAPDIVNASFPSTLGNDTPFAAMCNTEPTAADAVGVIQQYIADLNARRYQDAYAEWEPGANPLSYADFVAGYQRTTSVSVDIGTPGPIDAGAGQRYIEIPVTIHATLDDGTHQIFEGSFTLHHVAGISGATPEQQQWHIYSASLTQTS